MQHISYDNFFFLHFNFWLNHMLSLPINLWIYHTRRAGCRRSSTGTTSEVVMDIPTIQWLGMIIWLGQLLASMIFLRYHLWPFDHSPFIFMVVHLSLNWTSNCSAHGCPSKTLPIPCDAVPFLQWHSPFRIGILCPTSLNGYAGYAAMLWIYGCHHWDQAGRPFHNSLGANVNPGLINP